MKLKPLLFLFVAAAVLIGLAFWTSRTPEYAPPAAIGKLLLPDLAVNDVARLVVVNQAATVTVAKVEGQWVVAEKHHYPANFDRVRSALLKLVDIKIGDEVSGGAEVRQQLSVVTPDPAMPEATQVRLESAGGQALAILLLGKNRMHKASGDPSPYASEYPTGRYVSPDGGATLYVVKDPLTEFTAQTANWINTELFNLDAAEITRIAVTGPDRQTLELTPTTPGGMVELPPLAADEEADTAKLSALRNALAYFNLQDVADPARTDAELGFDAPVTLTAETGKGRIFRVLVGGKAEGEARYVRCQVEYRAPPLPDVAPVATNAEEVVVDALADTNLAAIVAANAAVQADVTTLAAQLAPWTFVVPSYKTDAMLVTRGDLVKPKTPEPAPAAPDVAEASTDADAAAAAETPENTDE